MGMDGLALDALQGLALALGIGLLVGIERERSKGVGDGRAIAGVRSFALLCLAGAAASLFEPWGLLVVLAGVGAMVAVSYLRTSRSDPGITTEVAALLVVLLGALAMREAAIAAALGVVTTVLLAAKSRMHRFSRELISEHELRDGLLLLASALVVLPLLPDRPVGPFDVLNPWRIWLLVVLVMGIGALGHIALRLIGGRWGLALAGFFAGYVSSTAATAGFGQRAREDPALLRPAVGAAMLANFASITLFVPLLAATAPGFLRLIVEPLAAAGAVVLLVGLLGLAGSVAGEQPTAAQRMFRFRHALGFALAVSAILLLAAALNAWLGPHAALAGATVAALAELHASALTLGQLQAGGMLDGADARFGVVGLLLASALSKTVLAGLSGGRAYGLRVGIGLATMCAAAALAALLVD